MAALEISIPVTAELAEVYAHSSPEERELAVRVFADVLRSRSQQRSAAKTAADIEPKPQIQRTPGVMGGDACVRNTRISAWLLVELKQSGLNDKKILDGFPGLAANDLGAVWEYYAGHPAEIDAEKLAHNEAA